MKGICKLCGQQENLFLSHIVPKSITRRMKGGAPQVVAFMVGDKSARKSNGEYIDRLLCESCEFHIKVCYEDYGTRALVDKNNIIETKSCIYIMQFQYEKYFLFILSILWRASASSLKAYRQLKAFSTLDDVIKPSLQKNTLNINRKVRLDEFIKLTIVKVFDPNGKIDQEAIDHTYIHPNKEQGETLEEGIHCYFMADGYFFYISLLPPNSPLYYDWRKIGSIKNRRHAKIPKVSLYEIPHLIAGIKAMSMVPSPFDKKS